MKQLFKSISLKLSAIVIPVKKKYLNVSHEIHMECCMKQSDELSALYADTQGLGYDPNESHPCFKCGIHQKG